ncbi:MAG: alanine racemase [Anaerovoracaceae bacterium]
MRQNRYPKVVVDLKKLRHNIDNTLMKCNDMGIEVAGVVKGCTGLFECAKQFDLAGCKFIASSRLEQLEEIKFGGIQRELMMIRVPMLSEAADVVRITDISLNSDLSVLEALNHQAGVQDRKHKVILMVDLGDLREGFWDKDELQDVALKVENDMYNLELAGVGTNLGCYGAVAATPEKLNELIGYAERIEDKIGRELEFISGGATTSLPRVFEGNMPKRINLLRVGEGILLAKDLQDLWGYDMSKLYQDVFTLQAEIIEIKNKPSYPVGEIMFDAYGNKPEYEDRGIRRRALLGIGKVDYAFPEMLLPRCHELEILGASSDHTIIDIENVKKRVIVGDIIEFDLCYATIVYVTNSPNVDIVYI